MKRPVSAVLVSLALCFLPSCGEDRPLAEPTPTAPKQTHIPAPAEEQRTPEAEAFVGKDSDLVGRWKKLCFAVPESPGTFAEEEISLPSHDSDIGFVRSTYTSPGCPAESRSSETRRQLIFETEWEELFPTIKGRFVKGWKALFREVIASEYHDYEALAHLTKEGGERVLYLKFPAAPPYQLDGEKDRFVFAGF
jgi:hypothetical protein